MVNKRDKLPFQDVEDNLQHLPHSRDTCERHSRLPQSYAVLFSGSAYIPMDLDQVVVDRFYHARDLFRAVNQLEDTVLIKSSSDWAQLVFENCQRFTVPLTMTFELGFERIWVRAPNGLLA